MHVFQEDNDDDSLKLLDLPPEILQRIAREMDIETGLSFLASCDRAHDVACEVFEFDPLVLTGCAVNDEVLTLLRAHSAFNQALEIYISDALEISPSVLSSLADDLDTAHFCCNVEIKNTNMVDTSFLTHMSQLQGLVLENGQWEPNQLAQVLNRLSIPVVSFANNAHFTPWQLFQLATSCLTSREINLGGCQGLPARVVRTILMSTSRPLRRFDCFPAVGECFELWFHLVLNPFHEVRFGKALIAELSKPERHGR